MAVRDVPAMAGRVLRDQRYRRLAYVGAAAVLGVLAVVPQPYMARARILPRDPTSVLSSALGAAGGRIQDLGALLGGSSRSNDLYLSIGQSADIRNEVIKTLNLVGNGRPYGTQEQANMRLERDVDVQSLPGGLLQIEAKTHDPELALRLTRVYTDAIADHLRSLNTDQTSVKRSLLDKRFHESAARLAQAQATLNEFRHNNRISAAPEAELGSALAVKSGLEAKLQAKLVELRTLEQMLGPDNARLQATQSEVQGLRDQLAQATSPNDSASGPNAGGLTALSTKYFDIYRDYLFAQSLYDVYARLQEQVAVEELSGQNAPTVQFVEVAHVEPGSHFNLGPIAMLVLLALVAVFTEFYAPATGIDLWGRREPGDAE